MSDSLQRERITKYMLDTYGTEAEYLWADSPGNAIFRHPASKKWYAAMMRVLPEKLGLAGEETLDVMDIRSCSVSIQEQSNKGKRKHLKRVVQFALAVFPKSATFINPSKRTLDNPAFW